MNKEHRFKILELKASVGIGHELARGRMLTNKTKQSKKKTKKHPEVF